MTKGDMHMNEKAIVLFDGDCHVCNSSVQFIVKRDQKAFFQFASLQSSLGQRLLQQYCLPSEINSLVVISGQKAHCESEAVLKICRNLDGFWKFFVIATVIPKGIRNSLYKAVANNRYRWFGNTSHCILLSADQKERFLS